jgi:hypothetical protein
MGTILRGGDLPGNRAIPKKTGPIDRAPIMRAS